VPASFVLPPQAVREDVDTELDTVRVPPDAWDNLENNGDVKTVLERSVILPLREQACAERHGLSRAPSVLLFGPPGTGKSALCRAVAGRLGWTFSDVDLSEVSLNPTRLRHLFQRLLAFTETVILFDEFEALGLNRLLRPGAAESLTPELLRGLPALRARTGIVVVCVTNYVRLLDPAVLRPGRFDLILPVGPPDTTSRHALLQRLLRRHRCSNIELETIVNATEGLTAADHEAICQAAAQAAFEREVHGGRDSCLEMADLLRAIRDYRPTLSPGEMSAFRDDAATFSRH
jgi:transitional endoplasmic reticulum ATPase